MTIFQNAMKIRKYLKFFKKSLILSPIPLVSVSSSNNGSCFLLGKEFEILRDIDITQ